ncbi:MAG: IclR family transcriptional regulator [Paracoccus sp. (in: a-proteobacteria)]|uniref:IclR family transcriptional regulator n=1 Tax=Paracoccus sp. TaxID=267 RepID=UPI0026DEC097|nr:IclR family transcriptional regulator [Paracoccus sp. (in: a-proteobacteria)]MDO5613904.1 IclR family transcriptional regulator [Paracoccus sp. (in: a-proteobacteria)]
MSQAQVPISRTADVAGSHDRLMVQALARGLRVMQAFDGAAGPLSLGEIAARAGMDRSAAQRLCHTLRAAGWLVPGEGGQGLRPGRAVLTATYDALRLDPVLQRASPILLTLRRELRERVDLSLMDGQRLIYAMRMQSKRENFFATLVGHTVPLAQTSGGWACLAVLPEPEAEALIAAAPLTQITPRTLTDPAAIRAEVAAARTQGHAVALEQIQMGEIALGVAIRDASGRPIGAIHVAGSLSEWRPDDFRSRVAPLAAEAAMLIEKGGGAA